MQKLFVEKEKTLSEEELIDLTTLAKSLPGTMIGNVAMLFGHRECGILGGLACLFGMVTPPFLILSAITLFYTAFRENAWVSAAMSGIRAAVVPIILSAAIGMIKSSFKYLPCVFVMLLTLALYLIFGLSCVYLVLIGAVCGLVISEIYERRGGAK